MCLYRISNEYQFLSYNFIGYDTEAAHLYGHYNQRREELVKQVSALAAQGLSQRKIARRLRIALSTVNVMLREGAE